MYIENNTLFPFLSESFFACLLVEASHQVYIHPKSAQQQLPASPFSLLRPSLYHQPTFYLAILHQTSLFSFLFSAFLSFFLLSFLTMENPSASASSGSGAQTSSSPYHHQVSFTGVVGSSGLAASPASSSSSAAAAPVDSSSGSAGYSSSTSPLTFSSPPPSGVAMTGISQDGGPSSMMYSSSSSSSSSSATSVASPPPLPSGGYESLQNKEGIFKEGTPYVSTTSQQPADPTAVQIAAIGQQQALYGPMGLPYNIHMMNASQRPTVCRDTLHLASRC